VERSIISWDNLYNQAERAEELNIKTHYEGLDIANSQRIHYICFTLPEEELPNKDKELKEILFQKATDNNEL